MPVNPDSLGPLAGLLRERLEIIGNQRLREESPERHLAELQRVSEAVMREHASLQGHLPPRLEHFMASCSYEKALDFIEGNLRSHGDG